MVITAVNAATDDLDDHARALRAAMPRTCLGTPAPALADPAVASWVRDRGATVLAAGRAELDGCIAASIRPVQVVLRGTDQTDGTIDVVRHAMALGVSRFVADDDAQLDAVRHCAQRATSVYLGASVRLTDLWRRIEVAGVSRDVDGGDETGWAAAVESSLCQLAVLRSCGVRPRRIVLSGGLAPAGSSTGRHASTDDVAAMAASIGSAMDEACRRWRLPRAAVTVVPTVPSSTMSPRLVVPPTAGRDRLGEASAA